MNRSRFLVLPILLILLSQPSHGHDDFVEAVESARPSMKRLKTNKKITELLVRFKPKAYVHPESYVPVNFYEDYLPKTLLKHTDKSFQISSPSRKQLMKFSDKEGYYLDYQPSPEEALGFDTNEVKPTYYGRVYRDTFTDGVFKETVLFLKYTPVFPHSGLSAELPWWKEVGSRLAGNRYGWHELDIHGATYIILREVDCEPLGLLLAQHNHHRVYWRKMDFHWPDNDRPKISYAKYSNEPYLISKHHGSRQVRTVGDPRNLAYLFGRSEDAPIGSGHDQITSPEDGAERIVMNLSILPGDDPLYTSAISLGDRKNMFYFWPAWHREGPPGIDFYAPPKLLDLADLAAFSDIDPADDRFFRLYERSPVSLMEFPGDKLLRYQRKQAASRIRQLNKSIPRQSKGKTCP